MKLFSFLTRKKDSATPASLYTAIGGRPVVEAIAHSFYDIMETDPMAQELLAIHPQPIDELRDTFFVYLMMWMGGPDEFQPRYGHPRLRARHLSVTVTPALKAQWMYCMRKAVMQHVPNLTLANKILQPLDQLADHMVNQPDA